MASISISNSTTLVWAIHQALLFANEFSISFSCKLCAYVSLWLSVALIEHCGLQVGSLLGFSIAYASSLSSYFLSWSLCVECLCMPWASIKASMCVCVCFGIERGEHCNLYLVLLMMGLHAPRNGEWEECWESIGECVCVIERSGHFGMYA